MSVPHEAAALPGPVAAVEAMTFVHSADLSPDGTQVAWSSSHIEGDRELITLKLTTVGSHESTEIGCGTRDHDPAWSPDGSCIAFLSDQDATAQVMVLNIDSMRVDQLTTLPQGVAGPPVWSPDGRHLAYTAHPHPARDPAQPYRVTRAIGWLDGFGLVDDVTADIYVVELATRQHDRLTADSWINGTPSWRPDSDELVYIATAGPDDWDPVYAVRGVSRDGAIRDLARVPDAFAVAPLPDGSIAVSSLGFVTTSLGDLVVIHPDGRVDRRSSELDLDVTGDVIGDMPVPFANPDGRILVLDEEALVRTQSGDRLEIHRLALHGRQCAHPVVVEEGCVYPLAVANGRLLYGRGTLTAAPDLWVRDLAGGATTQVTFTAAENTRVLNQTSVEELSLERQDAPRVQIKFVRPRDSAGPLPTVLLIHGGPKSAFGQAFFADAQLLCAAGFGVLMVNPRGSRGYGTDFACAIIGDWGNADYSDLMAGVDLAIERGLADPERLGVAGLSYGGYMTAWIATHTDRFRAAVVENPVTNFLSMYGTSDIGLVFVPESLGGTPDTATSTYLRSSPVMAAHKCVTPTLIVQGEQDHRCPPEQSLQFYAQLKRAGCTAELLMLPDASHEGAISGPVAARRAQNEALLDWMCRYVGV